MILVFHDRAWEDYLYWQPADRKMPQKVNWLIKAGSRDPFEGLGKPEPLRGDLAGWWSRRIDQQHRLIYRVVGEEFQIVQCRHHY